MESKKILIVTISFFPENTPRSFRATELAKEFARQGHDVNVLTIKTVFSYKEFEENHKLKVLDQVKPNKSTGSIFSTKRRFLKRVKDRFSYQVFLYPEIELAYLIRKAIYKLTKSYDLLISIAKPYSVHFACAAAIRKNVNLAKCWVADCGDPFNSSSAPYSFPFYIKWLEKWMFRKTDFISIPACSAKPAYPKIAQEKIVVIPQGFNFERVKLFLGEIRNPVPTFSYAGALYNNIRSPEKLLLFLATLDIDFRFVFYTSTTALIEPFLPIMKNKIEIRKPIPRKNLLYELSKMDFLVNIENTNKEMCPSKIIDYALTKRPVLSIHPEKFDPRLVLEFLERNYKNQFIIQDLEKYNITNVANQFLYLLIQNEAQKAID